MICDARLQGKTTHTRIRAVNHEQPHVCSCGMEWLTEFTLRMVAKVLEPKYGKYRLSGRMIWYQDNATVNCT